MTPISDMVERMFAVNAPAASIIDAVRTAEIVVLRERDDRHASVTLPSRTPAAIRAARYRENIKQNKGSAEANDAAKTSDSSRDANVTTVTQHCDLSSFLSSKTQGLIEEGSKKERSENARARATRLVQGTPLSDLDRAAAIELGAAADRLDAMWAEFVDYWIAIPGQRGTKLNWSATWRNRVRDVISRGTRNGQRNTADRSTSAAGGRVLEKLRRLNSPLGN